MEENTLSENKLNIITRKKRNYKFTRKHKKRGKKRLKINKGFTYKNNEFQVGGFFANLAGLLGFTTFSNMSKFKEFMNKLKKNEKEIKENSQGIESLASLYRKYSEERIKVIQERLIGMKASAVFPNLISKIKEKIEEAKAKAIKDKIKPNEYKSELANATGKMTELEIRMKALEKEDNALKKQVAQKKKEFDEKFKKTQKYMDKTAKVSEYYSKNVQEFEKKIENIQSEYEQASKMTPEAIKKDKYAKKRISQFKKYEKVYNALRSFGSRSKLNDLTILKDKIGDIRTELELFNSEFERLMPRNDDGLKKYDELIKKCLSDLKMSLKIINENRKELKNILLSLKECNKLITTQQAIDISQKFKDFESVVEKCISNIDNIESITKTVETEFFKLTPTSRLDLNLHTILTGIKSIEIVLRSKVKSYINDEQIPDLPTQ